LSDYSNTSPVEHNFGLVINMNNDTPQKPPFEEPDLPDTPKPEPVQIPENEGEPIDNPDSI